MNNDDLLSVSQIAKVLQVPKSWIYQATSKKTIPFVKIGKYVRFDKEEVLNHYKKESHEHEQVS